MSPFYEHQLEWIHWLHQFRTPWLDAFFKAFNYFDRAEFLFILIPTIWIGYHWKSGLRIFYALLLNGVICTFLKNIFMEPRPFDLDPTVGIITVGGYGFPSGAAQTVILLSGILLSNYKNKWTSILCANYIFWVSLSRVYLGVHFPTDILGGWIVGGLLWALYTYGRPLIEKQFEKMRLINLFLISQAFPILLLEISPISISMVARACAAGLGICLSKYWNILLGYSKHHTLFLIRSAVGVIGTFLCVFLVDNTFIQSILMGLWLSLGANFLFKRVLHSLR